MIPKVIIVGRPNVGKSSLLNVLAGRRVSIVDPTPGVTRDRVGALVELPPSEEHPPKTIELIDTGGHGMEDMQDLTTEVERQIAVGISQAQLILFVVDAQSGVLPLDREVALMLRRSAATAPVLVVANKVDGPSFESAAYEASQLGFGQPLMVSAANGYQKAELLDDIRGQLDWSFSPTDNDGQGQSEADMLLAIVGKRNAGKSTLVNAMAGTERVIVSEVEGTTRDAVDVRFEFNDHVFTAIDTAGVRKGKSIQDDVEYYSHHRAFRSIRRADVVMLLVDSSLPASQVDTKLANEILRHHKPCVVVVNKWDLAEQSYTQDQYVDYMDKAIRGLAFAPIAFISAARAEGIRDVTAMAVNLYQQAGHRVTTGELNRVVHKILSERTPVSKVGKRPKVYYVTQLSSHPPTIALFVNRPELFDSTYERFLLGRIRDELPFSEVPIKLLIRPRNRIPASARLVESTK